MKIIILFMVVFYFSSMTTIWAQEMDIESIKNEISIHKQLLVEKQIEVEFLSKFIIQLEKSVGDNSELIKSNKELENIIKKEVIEIKVSLFDLNEKLVDLRKQNNEIILEDMDELDDLKIEVKTKAAQFYLNEQSKLAFKNKTIKYKATIYNTNFSIPIARFNVIKNNDNKLGDIQMFNSIGAGVGMSWGTMTDYRDENGNLENSDFINSFSFHGGFLFSAGTEDNNVFAPVFTLGLLDFQLGFGVELGTINDNQGRFFITLGYAIPLYKLTKGKYLFYSKGPIFNEITTDL